MNLQMIAIENLVPHPMCANRIKPAFMKKLRRLIARTGLYEPLVVRPHPTLPGAFEILHGHGRKTALEAIGHHHAACLLWNLSDEDALIVVATMNGLRGKEVAARRLALVEALLQRLDPHALAEILPERLATFHALLEPAPAALPAPPPLEDLPEVLTVFLKRQEKQEVMAALRAAGTNMDRTLLAWARRANS